MAHTPSYRCSLSTGPAPGLRGATRIGDPRAGHAEEAARRWDSHRKVASAGFRSARVGPTTPKPTQGPRGRDSVGLSNKFITPTIANGKVYVATADGVAIFGLLSTVTGTTQVDLSSAFNQTFTVTYIDGTTATFTQSISDRYTPQGYDRRTIGHCHLAAGRNNPLTFRASTIFSLPFLCTR
jgi:hypothetical protein